jgi:hypothetical protein
MEFSNREIASLVWLMLLVGAGCCNTSIRGGMGAVVRVLFAGPIVRVITAALIYVAGCVAILAHLGIWTPANLKTTMLWAASFALLTMFDLRRLQEDKLFFAKIVREIVGVTVFVTFLMDTYTFGLLGELALVPGITFLTLLQATADTKPEHAPVSKLIGNLLTVLGLGYLVYCSYQAAMHWDELATVQTGREFAIPILLSLAFLPFLYALRLYVVYEQVFTGLGFGISDARLRRYAKIRAMLVFRFDLDFLKRWRRMMLQTHPTTKEAIRQSIREMRTIKLRELNPPVIPASAGWSPYTAMRFLEAEGFVTDDYHHILNGWRCNSRPVKVREEILADTLTYYVEGDERVANELTLELNAFNTEASEVADEQFWQLVGTLLVRSAGAETAKAIAEAIGARETAEITIENRYVRLTKEEWKAGSRPSYERNFIIRHIQT